MSSGAGKVYSAEYFNFGGSPTISIMPEKSRQAKMLGKDPLVQLLARTFGENVRVLREKPAPDEKGAGRTW